MKKAGNITTSNPINWVQLDMIIDYFAWSTIYGEDIGGKDAGERIAKDRIFIYDWAKMVGEIPQKTIRNHLAVQREVEIQKPDVKRGMEEAGDERARLLGWDSLSQKDYFNRLDEMEDLTFLPSTLSGLPGFEHSEQQPYQ